MFAQITMKRRAHFVTISEFVNCLAEEKKETDSDTSPFIITYYRQYN